MIFEKIPLTYSGGTTEQLTVNARWQSRRSRSRAVVHVTNFYSSRSRYRAIEIWYVNDSSGAGTAALSPCVHRQLHPPELLMEAQCTALSIYAFYWIKFLNKIKKNMFFSACIWARGRHKRLLHAFIGLLPSPSILVPGMKKKCRSYFSRVNVYGISFWQKYRQINYFLLILPSTIIYLKKSYPAHKTLCGQIWSVP